MRGKKCPRVGSRLKFEANPASLMLYGGSVPARGEVGAVVSVPLPGAGRRTCTGGHAQDLVYVDWPSVGVMGVARADVSKATGRGAKQMQVNGLGATYWVMAAGRPPVPHSDLKAAKQNADAWQGRVEKNGKVVYENPYAKFTYNRGTYPETRFDGGDPAILPDPMRVLLRRYEHAWRSYARAARAGGDVHGTAREATRIATAAIQGGVTSDQLQEIRDRVQAELTAGTFGTTSDDYRLSIGQRVQTPHGHGEVRSSSGSSVGVQLENGSYVHLSAREVRPTDSRQRFFNGEARYTHPGDRMKIEE